jgi:hypothetical protein
MKLKQIKKLTESESNLHEFVVEKWDGQEAEGIHIEPFDVLVKYHAEAGGHSDHPYGEGDAREYHADDIHVVSVVTNEDVHVESENGEDSLEHIKDIKTLHALVIGYAGTGLVHKVELAFPHAARFEVTRSSIVHFFDFMEDHQNDDVILDINSSTEFTTNPENIALLKAILEGDEVSFKSVNVDKKFTFKGRIIIVATSIAQYSKDIQTLSQLHPDPDYVATKIGAKKNFQVHLAASIVNRCVLVDLTQERTFAKGTRLQDIPGWDESSLEYFDEKAAEDFNRNR